MGEPEWKRRKLVHQRSNPSRRSPACSAYIGPATMAKDRN